MAKLSLQELETTLQKSADILQGELNVAQYKDYIFGLLFFKRMNDKFVAERTALAQEYSEQGLPQEEIAEMLKDPDINHSFFVPERARWESIRGLALDIGPALYKAFRAIEDEPKNSELSGVLTTANDNDKERVSDKKLSQLLVLFDSMQLDCNNLDNEDMIKEFADQGGSKGGEFYFTPTEVVKTIVRILKRKSSNRGTIDITTLLILLFLWEVRK